MMLGRGLLRANTRRGVTASGMTSRGISGVGPGPEVAVTAIREYIEKSGADNAFFHVNLSEIVRQYARWTKELPRVTPHYAVKCNNDSRILATLADLGCNFDCASAGEIDSLLSIGVGPERIVYANPCKAPSQLEYARAHDVKFTVFDSEDELYKIQKLLPDARLLLRIRPDDSRSVCKFGMKFGADVATELEPLLTTARELGLNVEGVSFHVGSGCYAAEAFGDAVALGKEAFGMAADLGWDFSVLDIGGGFPGAQPLLDAPSPSSAGVTQLQDDDYNSDDFIRQGGAPSFEAIAAVTRVALDEHFPEGCGVELLAEPGRYFVNTSHTLATCVIGQKTDTYSETAAGSKQYYIDDGIYGSFNCLMYDHAEVTPHVLKKADGSGGSPEICSVWGPTCDGLDCVKRDALLPPLQAGDWLWWENMGAYTAAAASSFNGFAPPPALYFYDGVLVNEVSDSERNRLELAKVMEESEADTEEKIWA